MAGRFNKRSIMRKVSRSKKFMKVAHDKAQKTFQRAKALMIGEFESHPVTRELQTGASARNLSNTLTGYGNLFTFIGFPSGYDPISPVRNLLIFSTNLKMGKPQVKGGRLRISTRITIPPIAAFSAVARMPWEGGRSWTHGIENGISGFGYYMYMTTQASRSGGGIQADHQIRAGNFRPTPYLSQIIMKFIARARR
jgi:hypothetical protein